MLAQVEETIEEEEKLPRRDWAVLPALGLLTMGLLAGVAVLAAHPRFAADETGLAPCLVLNDDSTGVRGVPNSSCTAKGKESGWIEYRFNSRGHRAGMEPGPKSPDTYRIVMAGSSIAMGLFVPREQSIAGLLPGDLSQLTGRKVEIYNTSIGAAYGGSPHSVALRFNEVLDAKPDMVLWILTEWDIDHAADLHPQGTFLRAEGKDAGDAASGSGARRALAKLGVNAVYENAKDIRTLIAHYLYESPSLYVKSYLMNSDDVAGFLRSSWSPQWNRNLADFDTYAGQVIERSNSAGVPLVAVLIPNRAQVSMISTGAWPSGYNPYKIDNEVRGVITRHGATFVDIFPDFRSIANPEKDYMPVDGHPYAQGHALLAGMIAQKLSGGVIPALKAGPAAASEAKSNGARPQ